jgi:DNA uptake protein ComE-like DNA-binding protein
MSRTRLVVLVTLLFLSIGCAERASDSEQAQDTALATGNVTTSAGAVDAPQAFLDPNAAGREELVILPGMDSAAAEALIRSREYDNMIEVDRVLSTYLTEAERDSVYTRLWKPIDLNSATGDEILLIPGVGPKMRHEFEEYRPYNSIARFRREIGKYVDSAEVARLEKYVTIR